MDEATALYWLHQVFPYLAFLVVLAAVFWLGGRTNEWRDRRRWQRTTAAETADDTDDVWIDAEHEEMRIHSACLEQAPVIPTVRGTDKKALRTCRQIMRATRREEARR